VDSFSVSTRSLVRDLTRQPIPSQPLSDDLTDGHIEAVAIGQLVAVFILPVVVAICLLVQIPEQMERLNAHIRAVDPAFQKTLEILKAVRMDLAVNILHCMVNYTVLELVQAFV